MQTFDQYLLEGDPNITLPEGMKIDDVSDGHHTFKELYNFRMLYNAALFNEWARSGTIEVYKARKHNDGEYPFGNESYFIVVAVLPEGQISNHYKMKDWDLFNIPAYEVSKYKFDGHTPKDVADRLWMLVSS